MRFSNTTAIQDKIIEMIEDTARSHDYRPDIDALCEIIDDLDKQLDEANRKIAGLSGE